MARVFILFASLVALIGIEVGAQDEPDVAAQPADRLLSGPDSPFVRNPSLSIAKTAPKWRYLNTPVRYEITVSNNGELTMRDVQIVDRIRSDSEFMEASDNAVYRDDKITWEVGDLQPGERRTVKATIKPTQMGELSWPTTVHWRALAQVRADVLIKGVPALLLEVIDVRDPVEVGDTTTYVITVTNQGSINDEQIQLRATLPEQLTFQSADGPTEANAEGQVVTFAPMKALAPNSEAVYKVQARTVGVGDIRFRLDMTSKYLGTLPVFETESTNIYE